MLTRKGLKMSISKCLRSYKVLKSKEVVTEEWGKHAHTNGYMFIDDLDNNRVILTWNDNDMSMNEKAKKVKELFDILNYHGFEDYMELSPDQIEIYLTNFV